MHRDIFDWTVGKGVTIVMAEDVHETGPKAVAERILEVVGTGAAYLSFDVDALDPAFAPGTGTPEVGGLATWQARAILRRLSGLNFAGMDVVEVSPPYDVAEITSLAAATIAWDYIVRSRRTQNDRLNGAVLLYSGGGRPTLRPPADCS